jgi:hypothetical protein
VSKSKLATWEKQRAGFGKIPAIRITRSIPVNRATWNHRHRFPQGEEEKGVIHKEEVEKVIRRYADFLRVPIHLNGSSEPVNAMRMPWERSSISPDELELDTRFISKNHAR